MYSWQTAEQILQTLGHNWREADLMLAIAKRNGSFQAGDRAVVYHPDDGTFSIEIHSGEMEEM